MTGSKFRVLVIAASQEVRSQVWTILHENGHDCREADRGRLGLALAQETEPDLILIGQDLPDLDGLDLAGRLKASRVTRRVPIAFLSGERRPLIVRRGVGHAPSDVLHRPIDAAELLALLERVRRAQDSRKRLGEYGRTLRQSPLAFATDGSITRRLLERQLETELERLRDDGVPVARLKVELSLSPDRIPARGSVRHSIANQLAERIRGTVRQEDLVASVDGGAFAILLADVSLPAARLIAEKIRSSLEGEPFWVARTEVRASARIEISHWGPGLRGAEAEPARLLLEGRAARR